MADIEKIKLPGQENEYDLRDSRYDALNSRVEQLESFSDFIGVTSTTLTDGATTNPIVVGGENKTAVKGSIAINGSKEFIFDGTKWAEFGDFTTLKDQLGEMAYVDTADVEVTYSKATGVTGKPSVTTGNLELTGTFRPSGNISSAAPASGATGNYTPAGTLSSSSVTVVPKTENITVVDNAGTAPSITTAPKFTASVQNKVLTLGWTDLAFNPGTVTSTATKSVMTGVTSATAAAQTFTGTATQLSFGGTESGVTVSGTAVTDVTAGTLGVATTTDTASGTATPASV